MQPNRPKRADAREVPLRTRALRMLGRREHSRAELASKLAPHACETDDLQALLDDLAGRGWLSEARVAEQLAHARKGRYGAERIRHDLIAKGVVAEVVASTVADLKETDFVRACALWRRRFGSPPADAKDAARQMRFLAARGFGSETARRVVRAHGVDPADESFE